MTNIMHQRVNHSWSGKRFWQWWLNPWRESEVHLCDKPESAAVERFRDLTRIWKESA